VEVKKREGENQFGEQKMFRQKLASDRAMSLALVLIGGGLIIITDRCFDMKTSQQLEKSKVPL